MHASIDCKTPTGNLWEYVQKPDEHAATLMTGATVLSVSFRPTSGLATLQRCRLGLRSSSSCGTEMGAEFGRENGGLLLNLCYMRLPLEAMLNIRLCVLSNNFMKHVGVKYNDLGPIN